MEKQKIVLVLLGAMVLVAVAQSAQLLALNNKVSEVQLGAGAGSQGGSGSASAVGGGNAPAPAPANLNNLPNMVGGC